MNLVIFSPNLKTTTGSPIRAFNIIKGLNLFSKKWELILVSSGFNNELLKKYKCYQISDCGGVQRALEKAVTENKATAILSITHGLANIASYVAKQFKIPFFVDIHGIRTLEIVEEKISLRNKIKGIKECLPWGLGLVRSAKIFCANPKLYSLLRLFFRKKVVPVCGLTDVSDFKIKTTNKGPIKVLYAGNLNPYQGVDLFLGAIQRIRENKKFEFYLASTSDLNSQQNQKLKKQIIKLQKLKNFFYLNTVGYKKYPSFLSTMDVVVVPRKPSLTAYMALPQKIIEAMSGGKYVIATRLAPHRITLTKPQCGVLCAPCSKSIAQAILNIENREYLIKIGESARKKAIKEYDLSVQIPKIIKNIEDVVYAKV